MIDISQVDPKNLWYIVGFIATDGNLSIDNRHINITSKDIDILFKIREALSLSIKVGRKSSGSQREKKYGVLQISDVAFYRFLESIGLSQSKSLTLPKLSIPYSYFGDFLRGVIDGDGNIHTWKHPSNNNQQWSLRIFSASQEFITWLQCEIFEKYKIKGRLYCTTRNRNNPYYTLKYGKFAAQIILQKIYYPNCLAIERKLQKAQECIQSKNKLRKYGSIPVLN